MYVQFENVFTHIEMAVAVGEVSQALSNEDYFCRANVYHDLCF